MLQMLENRKQGYGRTRERKTNPVTPSLLQMLIVAKSLYNVDRNIIVPEE